MTYTTGTFRDVAAFDGRDFPHGNLRRFIVGAIVIGVGTAVAAWVIAASLTMATAWMIAASLISNPDIQAKAPVAPKIFARANPYGTLAGAADLARSAQVLTEPGRALREAESAPAAAQPVAVASAAPLPPKRALERTRTAPLPPPRPLRLLDIQAEHEIAHAPNSPFEKKLTPAAIPASARANSVPLPPMRDRAEDAPAPPRPTYRPYIQAKRETSRPPVRQPAPQIVASAPPPPVSTPFSFFQKLFNPQPAASNSNSLPAAGSGTAIYDIEAHTVYLPNGDRLEAHSGLGARIDDPRYVNEKDRGATPPHVYDLVLRRRLFHGVRAMRLNPVGRGNMFGRKGILAHSYMLGPNGQSNGCVSFRDYPKFLQAFLRGDVKRLVVVAHLGGGSSRVAAARRGRSYQYASNSP